MPIFDYGDILYLKSKSTLLAKMQRSQNRVFKVCLKKPIRTPTVSVHAEAKVNFLEHRRLSHIYIEGHKRSTKDKYIRKMNVNLRCAKGILLKNNIPHCVAYQRSLEYTVSTLWNSLDPSKRNIRDRNSFKFLLKKEMRGLIPQDVGVE